MSNINTFQPNGLDLDHVGWKYYNRIEKKAMEQEFSWSGLVLSLSIAFFIVISVAFGLSFLYQSLEAAKYDNKSKNNIYMLESVHEYSLENYLEKEYINKEKVEMVRNISLKV